tara:strand:+ start:1973 stop:2368 length:396 start_codon:yes stop_codon:yes gene_type:complete
MKIDKVQRLVYGLGLLLWILIWIDDIKFYNLESSIGIKYYWIILVPTFILIGQIIFNSRILWWTSVALFGFYTIWTIWNMLFLETLVDYHRDYFPKSIWTFDRISIWAFIILILLLINWVIWKIKPIERHT